MEKLPDESVTEFTIRRIRAEIIEKCAQVCENLRRKDYSAESKDWIAGTLDCADALRALTSGQGT